MLRRLISTFDPGLPRAVWILQLGVLINFFGNGLVAPFLVIYLHFGRGLPVGIAAAAISFGGFTAVTSGLLAGALADRLGPRNILVAAMTCNAAAYLLYTQVTAPWQAFAVGLLVGVGTGSYGPTSQSLIAALVPAENRQAAFAQNRVTSVVGLGAGGSIGGLIASAGLAGYLTLLRLDAMTFLSFACVVLLLPDLKPARSSAQRGNYAAVLRDRAFVRLMAVKIAMVSFGIAPMLVLLPAFAKSQAHVGEAAIGAIYAANTLTIVAAQLPLTRLTSMRNRMRVLRAAAIIWIGCWTVCFGAGARLHGTQAALVLAAAAVTYAAGECLYSAIMLPTAASLAPDHLRGRYLGAVGVAWQAGFLIGPSLGGSVLGAAPLALPALCAVGCLAAAAGTVAVDRVFSPDQRLVGVQVRAA